MGLCLSPAEVVCDRPDIPNARLVEGESDPYGHKSTLRYECNVGYKMTPDGGNITCLENGWSSTLNCEGNIRLKAYSVLSLL